MNTIDYEESFGEIRFPEGFEDKLRGKTLEEQMECYRITESIEVSRCSYGEQGESRYREKVCSLAECSDCAKLVVKDGLLVGVIILAYDGRPRPCLPGQGVCTYFSCDDDGPGSTSRSDCARLDCV